MEMDEDFPDMMLEAADNRRKEEKENRSILDLDSPSYPPELDEYRQCGCKYCLQALKDNIDKQ